MTETTIGERSDQVTLHEVIARLEACNARKRRALDAIETQLAAIAEHLDAQRWERSH